MKFSKKSFIPAIAALGLGYVLGNKEVRTKLNTQVQTLKAPETKDKIKNKVKSITSFTKTKKQDQEVVAQEVQAEEVQVQETQEVVAQEEKAPVATPVEAEKKTAVAK